MIKENKKNKLITFICACLMVCASALGFVGSIGSTFALTSGFIGINQAMEYINNYQNYDLTTIFDGYINAFYINYAGPNCNYGIYNFDGSTYTLPSFTLVNDGTNFAFYVNSGSVYDNQSYITKFATSIYSKAIYYTSTTDLLSSVLVTDYIFSFYYNGSYYNFISKNVFTKKQVYLQGLADADTTSAYNNGYNTGYSEGQTNGYNSGLTQGQNNVVNNPNDYNLYTQAQYEQHYTNGYNTGVTHGQNNVINNPNAYGLYTQAQYQQNYTDGYNAGVIQGQNNVINNPNDFGLNTNQQLQDSYNQGFADGEQSSDAYQNGYDTGYTDGSNEVLNNPNSYGLYTLAQYEQNYQDGYIAGVQNSQYGILSNVVISGFVLLDDVSTNISNSDFNFNVGTITPNSSLLNKLNIIFNSNTEDTAFSQIKFTLNEQYIFTRDNIINFVNLSLLPNQTSYLPVTYNISSTQSVALIYSFNPIVENNVFTGFNVGIIGDDTPLLNNTIESFVISYANTNIGGITLTSDNLVKPQAISIFANNVAFNNGYTLGYNDAMNSDIVNNAYDNGYTDGNRVGYQQGLSNGLANANDYTFFGLIGAVIDAPIQYLSSLFNFNILGFNLLSFITSLFTVCVIIWIVKMLLGGK